MTQWPEAQVIPSADPMCISAVRSWLQAPQFLGSVDVSVQAAPHCERAQPDSPAPSRTLPPPSGDDRSVDASASEVTAASGNGFPGTKPRTSLHAKAARASPKVSAAFSLKMERMSMRYKLGRIGLESPRSPSARCGPWLHKIRRPSRDVA